MSKFQQVVSANSEVIELFRSSYSQYNALETLLKQNRVQKLGEKFGIWVILKHQNKW